MILSIITYQHIMKKKITDAFNRAARLAPILIDRQIKVLIYIAL